MSSRAELLGAARSFCAAFAEGRKTPEEIVRDHFYLPDSSSGEQQQQQQQEISAHEHGLPGLAPQFLGKTFRGASGVQRYFEILGEVLGVEDMQFPEDGYVVDVEEGRVACRGTARFTWKETGQSWDETFVYMLGFAWRGGGASGGGGSGSGGQGTAKREPKVRTYEVWADSGAAYLARRGLLDEVTRQTEGS